jgi:hypothetical protein
METAIVKAVMLFRSSPDKDDEQIHRALVDAGIDRKFAARLVELVSHGVLSCTPGRHRRTLP